MPALTLVPEKAGSLELDRLITMRVPLDEYQQAFDRCRHDVKVVLEINGRQRMP